MLTRTGAPAKEPLSIAGEGPARGAGAQVEVRGLRHAFGELAVIHRLDLSVAEHEVVGLVGTSGCGKSTLLELVAGLREPLAGTVAIAGQAAASKRLAGCAYMPQRDLLLPWYSAIDNAALALRNRGASRAQARAAAAGLFERFGLAGFERTRPTELSGGMRQRVAFLRTLLAGKEVLLLDEPFASLDAITRGEMQQWLAQALGADPRTVLLVSHDVEEALYLCDRVLVLSPRPGRVLAELEPPSPRAADRDGAVTEARFGELRAAALAALREGAA